MEVQLQWFGGRFDVASVKRLVNDRMLDVAYINFSRGDTTDSIPSM